MFIIGLGAVVLFIIGYVWYLVAYDAPLSTIPSSVDATTTAVAYLLSFHAPLHAYRLGSFITMCPTHIRILDSLLMAFVAILFVSGGLLALRATELAINSSFSALSVSILVLLVGLLSLAVIIGEVLALGAAMMAVFSSVLACVRCICFDIIHGFICLGCICLVGDAICIESPQRMLCIAIGEAELAIYSSFSALGASVAFGASLAAFVALYLPACGDGFYFDAFITHIRTSRIRTSTGAQDIAHPHIAPEQRNYITVITEEDACIALRCVIVSLCFCI